MKETKAAVVIRGEAGESTGVAFVCRFTASDAVKKALKLLGGIWLISALLIFVPIIHFFAVPLGFLLGPFLAFFSFRKFADKTSIPRGDVACSKCATNIPLSFEDVRPPLRVICMHCGSGFDMRLSESS